jgi:two-component system chemotaxis response regulator CheY
MSGKRILVVEANANDRQRLSSCLSTDGYEVLVAEDGAEAVHTVCSHPPDLVLLNTSFPPDVAHGGGAFDDGFHIISWLNRLKETDSIRFLLMTDEDAVKLHDKAKASGAKDLLQKPINPETLLTVVHRVLDGAPQQPE